MRFLYDYDNLLLSHADRSRVITDEYYQQGFTISGGMPRLLLVNGVTGGVWSTARARDTMTLTIRPFAKLSQMDTTEIVEEGLRLLAFLAPSAVPAIEFEPPR